MIFDPLAKSGIWGYTFARWYLSQCYGAYTEAYHSAFVYRWNKATEKRLRDRWIAARTDRAQMRKL